MLTFCWSHANSKKWTTRQKPMHTNNKNIIMNAYNGNSIFCYAAGNEIFNLWIVIFLPINEYMEQKKDIQSNSSTFGKANVLLSVQYPFNSAFIKKKKKNQKTFFLLFGINITRICKWINHTQISIDTCVRMLC